jgi:hypothetical protein
VAKRLFQDWRLLATQSESRPASASALEKLYGILCRGSQVYLFRTSAPFQAIKVPRPDFFEQIFQIHAQLHPAAEWIPHALSLLMEVKSEESTTAEMHTSFLSLLRTTALKASALEIVAARMAKYPVAVRASKFSDASQARTSLLRLSFQIIWAMGEKDRAVHWVRTYSGGDNCDEHRVLRLVLETNDYDFWMSTYEPIQVPRAYQKGKTDFRIVKGEELPERSRTGPAPNSLSHDAGLCFEPVANRWLESVKYSMAAGTIER